ncbi:MAG: hypothetical protein IH934_01320 [Nanoarchaeota archaeon]|nr:hypothetical protein [Nanoarchaeota archaeon]
MALSKDEIESIRDESQKTEQNIDKSTIEKPKNYKKILIVSSISVAIILIFVGIGFGYLNTLKPAPLDGFAQCLTEKGVIMYGASACQYTHAQKGMFGNSMRFIDSRDFTEDPNIKITPTWLINGKYYENVQTFNRLADLTGCKI